ncbi:hypothetical protein BWQ96_10089 [Gracilariopsis chorda]|uniref:Uncharacterized protein n=1 Tax=Gracilariopsis chorda TaxID=448386 RepID=A0A2V3IDN2_9FLOR|nr:hypothetical protein BWQ96_10089 [Gracilariopsis chorda]|eukprot:PXF40199.1 hypothetical protein BWQ96_10089 [Gracilariopsis chorda]
MATIDEEPGSTGKRGQGLGWSSVELLALTKVAYIATIIPIKGSGIKTAEFVRSICEGFLQDHTGPTDDCNGGKRGGVFDECHWDRRNPDSRLHQWTNICKGCSCFHSAMKRVKAVEAVDAVQLTGSPTSQDLEHSATGFYNLIGEVTPYVYDIIRNPKYVIRKPFAYPDVHTFLSERTTILDSSSHA